MDTSLPRIPLQRLRRQESEEEDVLEVVVAVQVREELLPPPRRRLQHGGLLEADVEVEEIVQYEVNKELVEGKGSELSGKSLKVKKRLLVLIWMNPMKSQS